MTEIDISKQMTFQAIDIARFLFSLLIVAFHFPPFSGGEQLSALLNFFLLHYLERLAVPFFFVCSGFFLYNGINWTYRNEKKEKAYLVRIIRLYLVWTVIYLPYSIYTFRYDDAGFVHALTIYLRDFIFTGSVFHLWYLNALAFAVFLLMISRRRRFNAKSILIIAGLLYMAGLTAQSWFGAIKPLEGAAPIIWAGLKKIGNLIVTTRNGLFEGFFYVAAGMYIAVNGPKRNKRLVAFGFALSMGGLLAEILILRKLGWIRATDIYLFQAPAAVFLFILLRDMSNQEGKDKRKLRKISGLIYYVHPLAGFLTEIVVESIDSKLSLISPLIFVLVLTLSLLFSVMVLKVSEIKQFSLLKKIY